MTAAAFVATLANDAKRFPGAHQVASYLGLVPREMSSGELQRKGSITRAGNGRMGCLLVQAAISTLRLRKLETAALRAWAERIAFFLLVPDLLWRGYRVVLSTHSAHVLTAIWMLRRLQEHAARWQLVCQAFEAPAVAGDPEGRRGRSHEELWSSSVSSFTRWNRPIHGTFPRWIRIQTTTGCLAGAA